MILGFSYILVCFLFQFLFFPVPAIGTYLFFRQTDCLQKTIQRLEPKGSEAKLFTNALQHTLSSFRGGIRIFFQIRIPLQPFQFMNDAACKQIILTALACEIQIFAAIHDGRTGRTHVNLLCMGAIKEFNGFSKLRTTNDGVIHKEQLFAFDQLGYGICFIFATRFLIFWLAGVKERGHVGVYFTKGRA